MLFSQKTTIVFSVGHWEYSVKKREGKHGSFGGVANCLTASINEKKISSNKQNIVLSLAASISSVGQDADSGKDCEAVQSYFWKGYLLFFFNLNCPLEALVGQSQLCSCFCRHDLVANAIEDVESTIIASKFNKKHQRILNKTFLNAQSKTLQFLLSSWEANAYFTTAAFYKMFRNQPLQRALGKKPAFCLRWQNFLERTDRSVVEGACNLRFFIIGVDLANAAA